MGRCGYRVLFKFGVGLSLFGQYHEPLLEKVSAPAIREVRRPGPSHAIMWHLGACSSTLTTDLRMEGSTDRSYWTEIAARVTQLSPNQRGECGIVQTSPYLFPYVRARAVSAPVVISAWYFSSERASPTVTMEAPSSGITMSVWNQTKGGTYLYQVGDTRRIEITGPPGATLRERGTWDGSPYEIVHGVIPTAGFFIRTYVVTATGSRIATTFVFALPGEREAPGPPAPPWQVTP